MSRKSPLVVDESMSTLEPEWLRSRVARWAEQVSVIVAHTDVNSAFRADGIRVIHEMEDASRALD